MWGFLANAGLIFSFLDLQNSRLEEEILFLERGNVFAKQKSSHVWVFFSRFLVSLGESQGSFSQKDVSSAGKSSVFMVQGVWFPAKILQKNSQVICPRGTFWLVWISVFWWVLGGSFSGESLVFPQRGLVSGISLVFSSSRFSGANFGKCGKYPLCFLKLKDAVRCSIFSKGWFSWKVFPLVSEGILSLTLWFPHVSVPISR